MAFFYIIIKKHLQMLNRKLTGKIRYTKKVVIPLIYNQVKLEVEVQYYLKKEDPWGNQIDGELQMCTGWHSAKKDDLGEIGLYTIQDGINLIFFEENDELILYSLENKKLTPISWKNYKKNYKKSS